MHPVPRIRDSVRTNSRISPGWLQDLAKLQSIISFARIEENPGGNIAVVPSVRGELLSIQ